MTKRPITWSDEELRKAEKVYLACHKPTPIDVLEFIAALGAVHPAECRERERDAWRCGVTAIYLTPEIWSWGDKERSALIQRDKVLPSLLPKSPPPLVLSTGEWVRRLHCAIGGRWKHAGGHWNAPECVTASDARKLADWLAQYGSEEEKK